MHLAPPFYQQRNGVPNSGWSCKWEVRSRFRSRQSGSRAHPLNDGFTHGHLQKTFIVSVLSLTTISSSREYSSHLMEEEGGDMKGSRSPSWSTAKPRLSQACPTSSPALFLSDQSARQSPDPIPLHPSSSPQSTTNIHIGLCDVFLFILPFSDTKHLKYDLILTSH